MQKPTLDFKEAAQMKILRPQTAAKGRSFDSWITSESSEWQRLAVVQLTRYLSLEANYKQDLIEHVTAWEESRTTVFPITEIVTCRMGIDRQALIGIVTFNQLGVNPVLYHCYLHPFFRGKGFMKRAWTKIQLRYPRFEVEEPLTRAMKGFLSSVDISPILEST